MLGSVSKAESEFGRLTKQPDEVGGVQTQSPYLIVSDANSVYQRARAAGAKIEIEIKDEDYGGRSFSCRDMEGHLWNVGTYDPMVTPNSRSSGLPPTAASSGTVPRTASRPYAVTGSEPYVHD